jgi:hypothetical protein
MRYRRIPPKKWPAGAEVRKLARQNSVKAMERLIELMSSPSQFVSVNAARTVLMRGEPEKRRNPRFRHVGPRGVSAVNVKIAKFNGESERGTDKRDRKLPVVQGGRQGSRDRRGGG